ncbi:hypothetical protein D0911_04395 [Zhongshania marina]|uniref:Uncharacterized protein n=1 Tax=Zhongshania marina TaxID=2304603 RepID=A0ABX9W946_9GAMM|nr:hypothetical protein D0911_04395 [Zhongshania marina]
MFSFSLLTIKLIANKNKLQHRPISTYKKGLFTTPKVTTISFLINVFIYTYTIKIKYMNYLEASSNIKLPKLYSIRNHHDLLELSLPLQCHTLRSKINPLTHHVKRRQWVSKQFFLIFLEKTSHNFSNLAQCFVGKSKLINDNIKATKLHLYLNFALDQLISAQTMCTNKFQLEIWDTISPPSIQIIMRPV